MKMKKIKILGLSLVCGLILVGCNNKNEVSESTEQSVVETTESTIEKPSATFEDGVITTDDFKLTLKNKQIVKSPTESGYGLYVVFDFTNTSEEDTMIPDDVINEVIIMEQTTDTSVFELANNYFTDDAFGSGAEIENQQMEKEKFTYNELLPGKTVEAIAAYSLEDTESPVEMKVIFNDEKLGSLTIELDKLERPEIPKTNENKETTDSEITITEESQKVDNDTIAQQDYWEAIERGLTEEQAAEYLSNKWYGDPSQYNESYYRNIDDYLDKTRDTSNDTIEGAETTKYFEEMNGVSDLPEGTSDNARRIYDEIMNIQDRELTSGEIQTLNAIEQGYYE